MLPVPFLQDTGRPLGQVLADSLQSHMGGFPLPADTSDSGVQGQFRLFFLEGQALHTTLGVACVYFLFDTPAVVWRARIIQLQFWNKSEKRLISASVG